MCTYRVRGHVHLAAQLTAGGVFHKRSHARGIQGEHPSLQSALLGLKGSGLAHALRQTVQVFLLSQVQGVGLTVLAQVLRELQTNHAAFLVHLAQKGLAFLVEEGTALHESLIYVVEEHLLLGGEAAVVKMHILDALKEGLVQGHVVGVLGEQRLNLLGKGVHLVRRLGTQQGEEYGRDTVEKTIVETVFIGVDDGVVESGLGGVVDDLGYLLVIAADAFDEGFLIVFQTNLVERNGVMGRVVRLEEGVGSLLRIRGIVHFLKSCVPIILDGRSGRATPSI